LSGLMLNDLARATYLRSRSGAYPATPDHPDADMPSLKEIKTAIDLLQASDGWTRIPAQIATYTIHQPGNYLLTGIVTVPSGHGIVISATDVTLDLN
jgi:hypothetical protein